MGKLKDFSNKNLNDILYKTGKIEMSHTLNKGITPTNSIVLSRLFVERDFAEEHNYVDEDGFFIIDENELSYHTGLSTDMVCNSVYNLRRREIIQTKQLEDAFLIYINDEKIIEYVEEFEKENSTFFQNWDDGLEKIQKMIVKLNKTSDKGE